MTTARPVVDREARMSLRDRISVDQDRLEKIALVAREAASQQRAAMLSDLEAAVRNGTYKPDPKRIAKEMLRSAEVTKQLQAMLD
jgi:negative regulator of flagellin synthesis FlgM